MFRETVSHLRDLPRYRQILATLVKYGYRDVVTALHLEGLLRPFERAAEGEVAPLRDRPRRLRMVCEELGVTFIKLGQLLSTRTDLLPEAYTSELAVLRDDVRPFPYEEAAAVLVRELGLPPDELFASFEREPVASASISQVHRGVLANGRAVAVKIRRPGIEKIAQADIDILKNLSQLAERRLPFLNPYHPVTVVNEFERSLRRELDLGIERRTMERCRTQLAGDPFSHVPEVFPDYCTSQVLCMEFIEGVRVDDLEGLRRMGIKPEDVAARGAKLLLTQIFRHGFFHADPHPGNLRVMKGGIIAPLDYGMFGQLDARIREQIAELLVNLMAQDTEGVLRALDALGIRGDHAEPRALTRDVGELVSAYSDLSLENIDLAQLLRELIALIRAHRLRIPPDLVLLIRTLVTIESVGRTLDPHFDIARHLRPFVIRLTTRRYNPMRLLRQATRTTEDLQRIATVLPDLLSQSLESIQRGELNVRFDVQYLDQLVRQLTRASHTLAGGIIIAGLIVGSSLIVREATGAIATLGYIGFATALVLGLGLLWTIFRGA